MKDQLAAEVGKPEEAEKNIARLQGELKKHSEELEAVKADSSLRKQAMKKAIGDDTVFQDSHDALQSGILKDCQSRSSYLYSCHTIGVLTFVIPFLLGKHV